MGRRDTHWNRLLRSFEKIEVRLSKGESLGQTCRNITVSSSIIYLFLFLPFLVLFFFQPSCVLGPFETLTILYTGDALGKIEPCG